MDRLRKFLNDRELPPEDASSFDWFEFLADMKKIVGNSSNNPSFIAFLMAKSYLCTRFEMRPFDVASKLRALRGWISTK
jgi:hypothetical protein